MPQTIDMQTPQVSCDACGLCCLREPVPPFMPTELDALPRGLQREVEAMLRGPVKPGQSCGWFDLTTKKCRQYEHRPEACRQFELAGEECLELRGKYLRPTINGGREG